MRIVAVLSVDDPICLPSWWPKIYWVDTSVDSESVHQINGVLDDNRVGAKNLIHVTRQGGIHGRVRQSDPSARVGKDRPSPLLARRGASAEVTSDRAIDEADGRCSARRTRGRRLPGA